MISKRILNPERVRRITGGFNYIPHRFLTDGKKKKKKYLPHSTVFWYPWIRKRFCCTCFWFWHRIATVYRTTVMT